MEKVEQHAWHNRAIRFLLYCLPIIIPALFSPTFFSVFTAPKLFALRAVTLVIIFLWTWKAFIEEKVSYRQGNFHYFLLGYAVIQVVATLTSTHIFTSLFGASTRFLGIFTYLNFLLIAFFVFQFLKEKKQMKTFLSISVLTASTLALYSIFQYFGWFQFEWEWSQDPTTRVFGTMGHSNHFGAYMGMSLLISVGLFGLLKSHSKNARTLRSLLFFGIFLQACALFLTASRGGLFATVISFAVVAMIVMRRFWSGTKMFFKKWGVTVAALMVIGIIGIMVFAQSVSKIPLVDRVNTLVAQIGGGGLPDRFSWWQSSVAMIKDRPIFGFGLGTFRDVYNAYRRTDYRVPGPGDLQDQITPESAHMEYLDIAATQGMIGFVMYLALIIAVLYALDKILFQKSESTENFFLALALKGGLLVYLLQVLVSFGVVETLSIFYLLLGLAASLTVKKSSIKILNFRGAPKYAVTFGVLIFVVIGGMFSLRSALAEMNYKNGIIYQSAGDEENALNFYENTVEDQPYVYEYHQTLADFALKTAVRPEIDPVTSSKFLTTAVEHYQTAITLNPSHPSTFFNTAMAYLEVAKKTGADIWVEQGVSALKKAIELSPNNPLYAYQGGKTFLSLGRKELAKNAFEKVLKIRPGYLDTEKLIMQAM